jgi:hypothetical protein
MLLFLLFACIQQVKNETIDTGECELSVVQYASGLSEKQTEVAETIESQLGEMEVPDNIIAAAIVNAVAESGLNPTAVGDKGKAIGAFQLHKNGLGHNLTVENRFNVVTNTNIVGIQILRNDTLFELDHEEASIPELAAAFAEQIMKPSNIEEQKLHRAKIATKIFPKRL